MSCEAALEKSPLGWSAIEKRGHNSFTAVVYCLRRVDHSNHHPGTTVMFGLVRLQPALWHALSEACGLRVVPEAEHKH